jgi:hypothetical protein
VAEQLEAQLGADHFLSYRLWDQITQLHQEQVTLMLIAAGSSEFES